ncbi:MAG TPA: hypothetical protein PLA77_04960 [Bacteroidales bacterium]|nr:hypothetical protein [Bacteroidales bacterium]
METQKQLFALGNDAKLLITLSDKATGTAIDVSVFERIDVYLGRLKQSAKLRWSTVNLDGYSDVTIEDAPGCISVVINRPDSLALGEFDFYYTVKCWKTDADYELGNCAVSSDPVYIFTTEQRFDTESSEL